VRGKGVAISLSRCLQMTGVVSSLSGGPGFIDRNQSFCLARFLPSLIQSGTMRRASEKSSFSGQVIQAERRRRRPEFILVEKACVLTLRRSSHTAPDSCLFLEVPQ
jgi:hypothetical protein